MPITKGAIRKQRADAKKRVVNARARKAVREAVSGVRKKPTAGALKKAYQALDRATKGRVVHKNKAARLKSRLARLVKKK